MKQNITLKDRKELETKMAAVFDDKIKGLTTELQQILIDDMVTAFENRLNVLTCACPEKQQHGCTMKKNAYH